ncbi:MAG: alpha-amylase [Bacteroidetes bacterium]|nr:MAG: alpha-amylase [Bacteroidota bacterium]
MNNFTNFFTKIFQKNFLSNSLKNFLGIKRPTLKRWEYGVTYEIFVKSFADSNQDGIGDLNGVIQKLPYLADLGVQALWLMPISPSPSYHKYDVTDFYAIHTEYGTMADFRKLVKEAHKKGIKIMIDLVLNHTSHQHAWFLDACNNPNSIYTDFYIWNTPENIAKLGENRTASADADNLKIWHEVAGKQEKYYALFSYNMPDLNYDNLALRQEIFKIGKFWIQEIGIDGFRLDAAKHIFENNRETDNHNWWIEFKNEMQKCNPNVYLVGEVWDSAQKVAPYLKGIRAMFNFDMSEAIFKTIWNEKESALLHQHLKNLELFRFYNPDYLNAIFLTNHDQNRIASALEGHQDKIKLAASILLTLSGSPYIYYGEELGMFGKKPDECIREPFIWGNPKFQTTWIRAKFSTADKIKSLAEQIADPNSVYHHYKKLIHLRNNSEILTYGELLAVDLKNEALLAFLRIYEGKTLLVIHNLSWQEQFFILPTSLKGFKHIYFSNHKVEMKEKIKIPSYTTLVLKME